MAEAKGGVTACTEARSRGTDQGKDHRQRGLLMARAARRRGLAGRCPGALPTQTSISPPLALDDPGAGAP